MPKYTPKPTQVEATQWHRYGDVSTDIVDHYRHPRGNGNRYCVVCGGQMKYHGWLKSTENGKHTVCPTDWIVEAAGEIRSVKHSTFIELYEEVKV